VEALESLSGCDTDLLARVAEESLKIHQPMSLQQAVIEALDRRGDPPSIALALARWIDYTPSVQNSAIEMAFRRAERLPGLLDAIESGQVPARMLAGVYRERLVKHADAKIHSRAKKLLERQTDEKADNERMERFVKALDVPVKEHDGAALFKKNCAVCHRLAGEGGVVGPDLSAIHKQPAESILKDILRPSDKITAGFLAYLAETVDGQVFIGVVSTESDNSITLQLASGQSTTLLRKQLADLKPLSQSLMPDNFAEILTPQDAAAILAWLNRSSH
jgi:putative heme-binding domain-containing protein